MAAIAAEAEKDPLPTDQPSLSSIGTREGTDPATATWPRRAASTLRAVALFFVGQWFLIGIGVVVALAHAYPNVARTDGILKAQYSIKYLLVAIIFFLSGLSLPLANLFKRAGDWKLHLATQVTNFLLFPTVMFAIVSCVRAADPEFKRFDQFALVGMVVLGCVPTTVSSNVVMTNQAGGDPSAATIEVVLGNVLMFFSTRGWEFGKPVATGSGGTGEIYRQVLEQLGYSVFIPLFTGEVIQYLWPVKVKWALTKLKIGKVGSLCLLGVLWSTFSTAFYAGAFQAMSWQTIVLVLLTNILVFGAFSVFLLALARFIPFPKFPRRQPCPTSGNATPSSETSQLFDVETTIALLFCGAAKGIALGGPVVNIMYGGLAPLDAAVVTIPLVLYQGSQVVLGQIEVPILRAWGRKVNKRLEMERGGHEVKIQEGAG